MTDITERLLNPENILRGNYRDLWAEAADEIMRLRIENEQLRAMLPQQLLPIAQNG